MSNYVKGKSDARKLPLCTEFEGELNHKDLLYVTLPCIFYQKLFLKLELVVS